MSDYWEYKTLEYSEGSFITGKMRPEPLESLLNDLGRVGWELVSATPNTYFRHARGLIVILKRRR